MIRLLLLHLPPPSCCLPPPGFPFLKQCFKGKVEAKPNILRNSTNVRDIIVLEGLRGPNITFNWFKKNEREKLTYERSHHLKTELNMRLR